jgi:hypothetical protein
MTEEEALAYLRELRGLERLRQVITAGPALRHEWRYAVTALDDRLRLLRYGLSLEPPELVAQVEARYRYELQAQEDHTDHLEPLTGDRPAPALRVH